MNGEQRNKPAVTDKTQVHIVGGGMAGLAAAIFTVRDAHIPGKNVHVYEGRGKVGGSLYGEGTPDTNFFTLGDWKFNDKAYNCTWNVLSEIPSLDSPGKSVTQEIFDYNRTHKKNARSRLIHANHTADNVETMQLNWKQRAKMIRLLFIDESTIDNRRIDSWFDPPFFKTNFWKVFSSMFAIEYWNDLVEMQRYMRRFFHAVHLMVSGRAETVTPYNNYNSMTEPMRAWLDKQGVNFEMGCTVKDLDFKPAQDTLTVERLYVTKNGKQETREIKEADFVFVTNGSMIADVRSGSMTSPAAFEQGKLDGSWTLWENIVRKRPNAGLGNPSNFCDRRDQSAWTYFVVNSTDPLFFNLYEQSTGNKPGQANMVTFTDSNWHSSILVPNHPHFRNQPKDRYIYLGCGFMPFEKGNFVDKKMADCNGEEMLTEICRHFGFDKELPRILKTSTCIPVMAPYVMSHFLTRKNSDRPRVVPEGSKNLAFMGQFTESGECVMLVESSIRSAMMAVTTLLHTGKKVPPVYSGVTNPLILLRAFVTLMK